MQGNCAKLFKEGTAIASKSDMWWNDKVCRLLLGVLVMSVMFIGYCVCWAKQAVVLVDGREISVLSLRGTVADALAKAEVTLRRADIVEPAIHERLLNGQIIKVVRVETKEVMKESSLEYQVVRKPDHKLRPGEQRVQQQGQCGLQRQYIQATFEDVREVKREVLRKEVLTEPQPKVIAYGPDLPASRGKARPISGGAILSNNSKVIEGGRVMQAVSTAYTHTGHRTATGIYPYEGVAAVDPQVIPLGTKLYVENYGIAIAADTGGGIKGNRIDVFFDTHHEAINWGRRTVKIHILE